MPLPGGRPYITNETPGPALALLSICSAGASALVAGSAIAYQLKHKHLTRGSKLDLEWNIVLTIALAVCIAQSALTAVHVQYGLGYPVTMLTSSDVTMFLKLEYANNLLYIVSLILLKAVQFMLQIATTFQKPNYWAPAVIMCGMLGFLFAAAFECSSPFWKLRDNQCVNQSAFWYAFGAFDVVSDVYSITVVLMVTTKLRLHAPSKVKLLVILATKFLPVFCAIARFAYIQGAYTSPDYTITLYRLGVPTQIQLHLSVVALSLGKIFRFLNSLDVGYLSSSIEPTQGKVGANGRSQAGKYAFNSKLSQKSSFGLSKKRSISDHESSKGLVPSNNGRAVTQVEGGHALDSMHHRKAQTGSLDNGTHTEGDGIWVTTNFEVVRE